MNTCPHCHKPYSAQAMTAHVSACLSQPGMRYKVLRCLSDLNRPDCGVTQNAYSLRRAKLPKSQRPPSYDVLVKALGSWAAVCKFYRLQPSDLAVQRAAATSEKQPKQVTKKTRWRLKTEEEIEAEFDPQRQERCLHYRRWWLLVCKANELPDGRQALMLE